MFDDLIYVGPPFDDAALLTMLPADLAALLLEDNGVIAYEGGLHVRGACRLPAWHSLRGAWLGPDSVADRYPEVEQSDIPFAEDCLGNQFLLRNAAVLYLNAETGEVAPRWASLADFLSAVRADPTGILNLEPLIAFEHAGGMLAPGKLLNVYPPYCDAATGDRSVRPIDARDRYAFLASVARKFRNRPDLRDETAAG